MNTHDNNQAIYEELKKRFPELWTDEPLPGADAVDRLVWWKKQLDNIDEE